MWIASRDGWAFKDLRYALPITGTRCASLHTCRSSVISDIDEMAFERRGRRHDRRHEMRAAAIALTAFEVAV